MLEVYTAQYAYDGKDRLDITVGGRTVFAPTWKMVLAYRAKKISQEEYTEQYIQKMRGSYNLYRKEWNKLLSMKQTVLVCYCARNKFCHRKLLARILVRLGAVYKGELNL